MVCALDNEQAGTASALAEPELATLAVAESARRGYVDGQALAGVFTWLRPNDLVWNYVVNNYLLGKQPPAFDVLYWNQDTVRLAAGLHRDFVRLALDNALARPGAFTTLGTPVDLGAVDRRQLRRRRRQRPHRPVGERLAAARAARRRHALRALDERPHPGAGEPAGGRRQTAGELPAERTLDAPPPPAAGGPTTTPGSPSARAPLAPRRRTVKPGAKAPGTYVHAN